MERHISADYKVLCPASHHMTDEDAVLAISSCTPKIMLAPTLQSTC